MSHTKEPISYTKVLRELGAVADEQTSVTHGDWHRALADNMDS